MNIAVPLGLALLVGAVLGLAAYLGVVRAERRERARRNQSRERKVHGM